MATHSPISHRSNAVEPYPSGSPLFSFYRQANRLFEDAVREFEGARDMLGGILAPNIDVTQDNDEIRITAELPGVKQDDVDVSVDQDVLTIRAEKRAEYDRDAKSRHIAERTYGMFQRSLKLPHSVDPDQIQAHFDQGVLTVCLPASEQEDGRKRIRIEAGAPPQRTDAAGGESRH